MRDGAHTHHGQADPSGFGLALSIAGGLVLASVIESVLPVLLIVLAVVAGLLVLGLITYAVTTWSQRDQVALNRPVEDPALPGSDREQTAMLVIPSTAVDLPVQHQHLHFHGLDPAQVAAILAVQRDARPDRDGEAW